MTLLQALDGVAEGQLPEPEGPSVINPLLKFVTARSVPSSVLSAVLPVNRKSALETYLKVWLVPLVLVKLRETMSSLAWDYFPGMP